MHAAHEAALACAEEEGAWLPLLPIKTFLGKDSAVWATEENSDIDGEALSVLISHHPCQLASRSKGDRVHQAPWHDIASQAA